jgi:hypothetical protein
VHPAHALLAHGAIITLLVVTPNPLHDELQHDPLVRLPLVSVVPLPATPSDYRLSETPGRTIPLVPSIIIRLLFLNYDETNTARVVSRCRAYHASAPRFHRFQVFVLSLRQSGYTGDIVLFTNMTADPIRDRNRGGAADDPRIVAFLNENKVQWHDASKLDKELASGMHPKLLRYHLYAQHAARPEYQNSLILLVDFRDVVFQADPFHGVELHGEWLRFYEEIYPPSIKSSVYTYECEWLPRLTMPPLSLLACTVSHKDKDVDCVLYCVESNRDQKPHSTLSRSVLHNEPFCQSSRVVYV